MIEYRQGDMFESGADALVNAVNCMGVMGKGLALEFKKRYPLNFLDYQKHCRYRYLTPGDLHITQLGSEPIIINFATKDHWKNPSKIEWIKRGCKQLRFYLDANQSISSVAIPALGCGLGGLPWNDVKAVLVSTLNGTTATVMIYEPILGKIK